MEISDSTHVELNAVIEFLKRNELSESVSALMEDIAEKKKHSDSDLERFYFPVPAPVRVTANLRHGAGEDGEFGGGVSEDDDDGGDEFVSLCSSSTTSSDFTNPYGIRTTRPNSPTSTSSSDRMSQFGTARDYPDLDMHSNLFWYEDYHRPPLFNGRDFDGELSEDKYILTESTENLEHGLALTSSENRNDQKLTCKDYRDLGEHFGCSAPLCACCNGDDERLYKDNPREYDLGDSKIYDNYDFIYGEMDFELPLIKPAVATREENGANSDELKIYEAKEDDYEHFDLRIIHRKNRTGFEENKDFPIVLNSVTAGRYLMLEFLGSSAFSKVVRAHDFHTGRDVCLKIIKNDKEFFDQSLGEIKLLKFVNKHDPGDERHILRLYDYFYHQEHLFLVTELLKANLYEFQKFNRESEAEPYFTMQRLQIITRQILEALMYLHELGIIHCDLKPENILIKSYKRCEIKIINLGSSCFETDNLSLYVQSRSYRAPEVILGLPYDKKIDIWSVGCILAELYSGEVLFPNESVVMILARMIGILGPIDNDILLNGKDTHKYFTIEYDLYYIDEDTNRVEYIIPEKSSLKCHLRVSDPYFIDFLKLLLEINPEKRPTAKEALQHPWLSHSYEFDSC